MAAVSRFEWLVWMEGRNAVFVRAVAKECCGANGVGPHIRDTNSA